MNLLLLLCSSLDGIGASCSQAHGQRTCWHQVPWKCLGSSLSHIHVASLHSSRPLASLYRYGLAHVAAPSLAFSDPSQVQPHLRFLSPLFHIYLLPQRQHVRWHRHLLDDTQGPRLILTFYSNSVPTLSVPRRHVRHIIRPLAAVPRVLTWIPTLPLGSCSASFPLLALSPCRTSFPECEYRTSFSCFLVSHLDGSGSLGLSSMSCELSSLKPRLPGGVVGPQATTCRAQLLVRWLDAESY
ncbi:uncharacterized protein VDAG_08695 [Verticillium dahliae VdLs.17]|uniref:Secreted protein n=1 Tax=Verticillium dahliae (strain VdLs.17 / ATCC MYA-4575 / FGSC 10137) TaxID=498257 RepID=G2XEW3_VERDV|nr:uncharacterized protein VDAG_08695 [Verticillium dahliae VdLs.17]EGY18361.1 hypothetical protein VDAG_08695 [Verticillium dahliae VdLs.17]